MCLCMQLWCFARSRSPAVAAGAVDSASTGKAAGDTSGPKSVAAHQPSAGTGQPVLKYRGVLGIRHALALVILESAT